MEVARKLQKLERLRAQLAAMCSYDEIKPRDDAATDDTREWLDDSLSNYMLEAEQGIYVKRALPYAYRPPPSSLPRQ